MKVVKHVYKLLSMSHKGKKNEKFLSKKNPFVINVSLIEMDLFNIKQLTQ
jgi:hypothetical protein